MTGGPTKKPVYRALDLGPLTADPLVMIDLTEPSGPSSEIAQAGNRLYSYTFFPEDRAQREAFMAYIGSHAIANFRELRPAFEAESRERNPSVPEETIAPICENAFSRVFSEYQEFWFEQFGGHGSLAEPMQSGSLRCKTLSTRHMQGRSAGGVLVMLRMIARCGATLDGEPSLKKAYYMLAHMFEQSESALQRNWQLFKNIAHILAAREHCLLSFRQSHDAETAEEMEGDLFYSNLGKFLAVAKAYEAFMLDFSQRRRKSEKLVAASKLWRVPGNFLLPDYRPPEIELGDDLVRYLRRYRAA